MNGEVSIEGKIRPAMIQIGFGEVPIFDKYMSRSIWNVSGHVIFKGRANLGHGAKLDVENGALIIGNQAVIVAESTIVCRKKIVLGNNCVISWDNLLMDSDLHAICDTNGDCLNSDAEVIIGDCTWIGCRCTILKGSFVGDGCIIGAGTLINKRFDERNLLIVGNPAKVLTEGIHFEWDHQKLHV